ncbi:MAG: AraC family transcriptional regulator [Bacteroidetes bacterium]|nr:AraC family transcriptional regulator [Bacteroidota bacterium]
MASLSLREGVQEHLVLSKSILNGISAAPTSDPCIKYSSGYSIKYAYNSHETYWLNGKRINLAPGESLFLNLNYNHSLRSESTSLSRGLCLHYQDRELEDLFGALKKEHVLDYSINALRKIPELRFERGSHLNQKLKMICQDLESDLQKIDANGFDTILEEMLMEIDWELIGFNQRLQEFSPATRQALVRKVITARRYMKENLHLALRLEDVAKVAGISPFHFQRQYKKATGYSPARSLTYWRIERAKKLLLQDEHSVLAISTMLAYNDLPTFSKAFKRETGNSPLNWKSENQKNYNKLIL